MKKLFQLSLIVLAVTQMFAQTVISTNPNYSSGTGAVLDVDGSITIRDRIYAGGNDVTLGKPGKAGQVLVSQGPDLPPLWRTLNVPNIETGNFYLIYNNSFSDYRLDNGTLNSAPGQLYPGNANVTTGDNGPYTFGQSTLTGFTPISGLTKQFDVFSNQNQVYITFEAVGQIDGDAAGEGVDFVCGILVGSVVNNVPQTKTLRGIRKATLYAGANANPFITFTQIALAEGLTIGKYEASVSCKRTANYGGFVNAADELTIGRQAPGVTNLNNFGAQTSLKVEVYELPTVFNDVLGNQLP